MGRPEDIVPVPGTRWLIASGYQDGSGLKLVDTRRHVAMRWRIRAGSKPDTTLSAACDGPPSDSVFNAHGISLRHIEGGRFRLDVVNHGGRESVEIFEFSVGRTAGVPPLVWKACLPMPPGLAGNAVATFADGTVLTTVLTRPGTTIGDFMLGRPTGGVYEWRPGSGQFDLVRGTELPGNNGLETAPDGRHFYVVAFGLHAILEFDRQNSLSPLRTFVAADFMPDNIHWFDGGLLAAGMKLFEPGCGGFRKVENGVADPMLCHRGYSVALVNLASGKVNDIASGSPEADFNGVSSAAIVGHTLWLGSYQADRLAYRPLNRR